MSVRGFRKADGEAVPEAFDDPTVGTMTQTDAPPPPVSERAETEADAPVAEKPGWASARDAIASRFEAARDEIDEPKDFENANDPELAYGRAPAGNTFERDADPAETGRDDAPPADEPVHVLKVNGREVRITQSQLVGIAQKNLAADAYLAQAKAARDEALRALANSPPRQDAQREPSDATATRPAAPQPAATESDEDLASLVERIQLGDPAEATKALREFVARTAASSDGGDDVEKLKISNRMIRDEEDQEKVFAEFPKANPDLHRDKTLLGTVYRNAQDVMLDDLRNYGIDEEKLAELDTPDKVGAVHRYFRVTGAKGFRTPTEITAEATQRTREWLGRVSGRRAPAPQTHQRPAHDRLEAKRGLLPQPRRSSAPPTTASPSRAPAAATPQGRSNTVQEMRRARGQTVA